MKIRRIFPGIVAFLLIGMIISPYVFAQELEETETTVIYYRVPYGNGIDDNGDGVIDDLNETDVKYGNIPVNTTTNVFDTWVDSFSFRYEEDGFSTWENYTLIKGVKVGAYFEALACVMINTSISPIYKCYVADPNPYTMSYYKEKTGVIPLVKYYVNISSGVIMNGAQEMWYRSPIRWDNTKFKEYVEYDADGKKIVYPHHYLNVYDSQGNLIFATPEGYNIHSLVFEDRVYTYLNCNFRSGETYTFIEYVEPVDGNPINSFELYFAPTQDIANDNQTETIVYPNTSYSKITDIECSWSMVFQVGLGLAGTEKIVINEPGFISRIYTQAIKGSVNNANQVTITMPFRTTTPVEVHMWLWVKSGNSTYVSDMHKIENVTGTIIHQFNFTDPNPDLPNYYSLEISIHTNSNDTEYCTYLMIPDPDVTHEVIHRGDSPNIVCGFAVYFEINNETYVPIPESGDYSVHWLDALVGVTLIFYGFYTDLILMPISFITFHYFGKTVGSWWINQGFKLLKIKTTAKEFYEGISKGYLRGANPFNPLAWLRWLTENLWDLILTIAEKLKKLGEAIAYYGGIVMKAISEVIYFIAFLLVIYLWYKFLHWMRLIALARWQELAAEIEGMKGNIIRLFRRR